MTFKDGQKVEVRLDSNYKVIGQEVDNDDEKETEDDPAIH